MAMQPLMTKVQIMVWAEMRLTRMARMKMLNHQMRQLNPMTKVPHATTIMPTVTHNNHTYSRVSTGSRKVT